MSIDNGKRSATQHQQHHQLSTRRASQKRNIISTLSQYDLPSPENDCWSETLSDERRLPLPVRLLVEPLLALDAIRYGPA